MHFVTMNYWTNIVAIQLQCEIKQPEIIFSMMVKDDDSATSPRLRFFLL